MPYGLDIQWWKASQWHAYLWCATPKMVRKDPVQELDRPHYYSQFWIDIASGKRDASAAPVADVDVEAEPELEDSEPEFQEIELPKPVAKAKPAKPEKKPEPVRPTITSLADLANIDLLMKNSAEMEGDEVPDLETGAMGDLGPFASEAATEEPGIVTNFDLGETTAEPQEYAAGDEEEEFGDLDYDEEEEEDEWGSPRKPSKPSKQQRRRDRDRGPRF